MKLLRVPVTDSTYGADGLDQSTNNRADQRRRALRQM